MSKTIHNRGRLEIMGGMLGLMVSRGSVNKTRMMQVNNMSLEMVNRYTDMLAAYGFLEFIGRTQYRATERGLHFFKLYSVIEEMLGVNERIKV